MDRQTPHNQSLRPARIRITEAQLSVIIDRIRLKLLSEGLRFDTEDKRKAFIRPGSIITFKQKYPGLPTGQIVIDAIKTHRRTGSIKLANSFKVETPWFFSMDALLNAIDWEWMEENLIFME